MTTADNLRHAAALARAVAILRKSPEPGEAQKTALSALVDAAARRSATFRFYDQQLTVDGTPVPTTDPRLAAFTQRLAAQDVAEITIAQGAGPDELLALSLGLAADPGQGRVKERLRDAGSTRVMVVMHQYGPATTRSISAAFEKVKADQAVLTEWNRFLGQGATVEPERLLYLTPPGSVPDEGAAPEAQAEAPPPAAEPRAPRPTLSTPLPDPADVDRWLTSFEQSLKKKLRDHFGDAGWGCRVDRAALTVTAGDLQGYGSVTVALPADYLDQSAWLLAGNLLVELRKQAEAKNLLRSRSPRRRR
jgi:hypothetical protein